jgi:hypothetical protein
MMRQRGTITENFQCCYARRPDATLQILTRLRQLACERQRKEFTRQQRDNQTQAGHVRKFLADTVFVVKKNGQLIPQEKLTAADFLTDGKTLKRGSKFIRVVDLTDGEIAQLLTEENFSVTADSVKRARQDFLNQREKV